MQGLKHPFFNVIDVSTIVWWNGSSPVGGISDLSAKIQSTANGLNVSSIKYLHETENFTGSEDEYCCFQGRQDQ